MLPVWFVYVASFLRLAGGLAYLRATLRGEAKPNPLSWLLWGVAPLIAFFAALSAGVGAAAFVTLAFGISPLMVFAAAMYKNPRSLKFDRLNITCGALALAGLVLWAATDHPQLAIVLAMLADFASGLPTVKKTIHHPHTEYAPTYAISGFSVVLMLLASNSWAFAALAYPVYVLVLNLFMVFLIVGRRSYIGAQSQEAQSP